MLESAVGLLRLRRWEEEGHESGYGKRELEKRKHAGAKFCVFYTLDPGESSWDFF